MKCSTNLISKRGMLGFFFGLLFLLLSASTAFAYPYLNDATRSPAPGSTTSLARPTISIQQSQGGAQWVKVYIDGTYRANATPTWSYTPTFDLVNGSHTVLFEAGWTESIYVDGG